MSARESRAAARAMRLTLAIIGAVVIAAIAVALYA